MYVYYNIYPHIPNCMKRIRIKGCKRIMWDYAPYLLVTHNCTSIMAAAREGQGGTMVWQGRVGQGYK